MLLVDGHLVLEDVGEDQMPDAAEEPHFLDHVAHQCIVSVLSLPAFTSSEITFSFSGALRKPHPCFSALSASSRVL